MSRILRRPMFRGGRVDSRGTGITSGLSYAKGGSVNIPKRGLVDGPGGYAGLSLAEQRAKLAYEKPGTTKYTDNYVLDRLNEYKGNLYTGGIPDVDIEYGMQLIPPISDERQAQINYMTDTPKEFEKDFYEGKLPGADTNYNKLQSDQLAAAKLAGDEDLFNLLTKKDTPVLSANVNTNTGTGEQSSDDLLDIDKEKFAKLLGGDKARGEDISNMLMSFAGKALKPEATVKGAFGEFFEEEAKRPGRTEKIDQAAATLAINEYIAGKKSKAELDRFFAQADYSTALKSRTGKKNIPINITDAAKSFGTGYKAIDFGLKISFPESRTNKMDASEGQTIDKVPLTVDNIGQIFIEDEAPYSAVMITIEDGKLIRDPLN